MKKLRVMYEKPEVTDEELAKYMNFERLLEKRTSSVRRKQIVNIAGTMTTIGIVALVIFWMFSRENNPDNGGVPTETTIPQVPLVEDPVYSDSAKVEEHSMVQAPAIQSQPLKEKQEKIAPATQEDKQETEPVYVQSAPVNGYAHLYAYFERELVYPVEAIPDSIQGTVTVHCIIGKDGIPKITRIENSLGKSFDTEVSRIITNMPAWNPATLNGIPMESKISLPLTFKIKSTGHEK